MKLKTNLSPEELDKIGRNLCKVAKARKREEQQLEKALLLNGLDNVLDIYMSGLKAEFEKILGNSNA